MNCPLTPDTLSRQIYLGEVFYVKRKRRSFDGKFKERTVALARERGNADWSEYPD